MTLIWISVFRFQHYGITFVVFCLNYIAVTLNQMLCGVNFPSIFSKGHNPLQFETWEGLIYFEISILNFYSLAHLVDIIISILLTFWIVVFLLLIQNNDKFISHLKNVLNKQFRPGT